VNPKDTTIIANTRHTAKCTLFLSKLFSLRRNISIERVVVIAVRAESALENEADIMPSIKQIPAIGDIIVDANIGIILSGSEGKCMPWVWA
jgi:hypothetical protein